MTRKCVGTHKCVGFPPPTAHHVVWDLRDFRRWWRSKKSVGVPLPSPPPPPAHQLFWDLRNFRRWWRSEKKCRSRRLAAVRKSVLCPSPFFKFLDPPLIGGAQHCSQTILCPSNALSTPNDGTPLSLAKHMTQFGDDGHERRMKKRPILPRQIRTGCFFVDYD